MNKLYKRDIGWGIFFLALAILVWIAVPYQIKASGRTTMGPRFFPRVISLIMGTVSIGLIISNWLKHLKDVRENKVVKGEKMKLDKEVISSELRAIAVFVLMIAYAVLMPMLGFIVSSILVSGAILLVLGARKWYYYIIMLASILLIFYLFKYQLYVQLP